VKKGGFFIFFDCSKWSSEKRRPRGRPKIGPTTCKDPWNRGQRDDPPPARMPRFGVFFDSSILRSQKRRSLISSNLRRFIFFQKKEAFYLVVSIFCLYLCSIVIDVTGYKPVRISLTTKIIPVKRRRSRLRNFTGSFYYGNKRVDPF